MVKKLNPSFVEYFAAYLKKLLSKTTGTITAKDFQEHVTTAANVYLNENYGADPSGVRSAIAQSTPENECTNAIKARIKYEIGDDNRITFYKNQAQISSETKEETLESAKKDHLEVKVWTSKTNMLLPDATGRKRQQAVEFTPITAVKCGKCWICMTDVMSYSGNSINKYNDHDIQDDNGTPIECTTPCGDCEHVSAIMASYIAGMLTSSGFAKVYWASYYVACVECNRRKSNYIGVKLSATKGWEVDDNGVNAIVDAIFPMNGVDQHASEYNPIRNALSDKYNIMTPDERKAFRVEVRKYIVDGTRAWCGAANTKMGNMTEKTKHIKMSFNVSKIIVAITGHLNVITGPLQKRANKAVKAGRTPVKPKLVKKRGGGKNDENDTQDTMVDGASSDDEDVTTDKMVDGASSDDEDGTQASMLIDVTPVNPPILNWYNLIGEAEVDAEYDDEDDKEDDRETDDEFNARILNYRDVIVEYIGNTYSRILFNQYQSDPTTFEELMVNLSESMYETLESTNKDLPKLTDETLDLLVAKGVKTDETLPTVFEVVQITPLKAIKVGSASQPSQNPDDMAVSSDQPAKKAKTESAAVGQTVFEFAPGAGDESAQYQLTARQVTNPEAAILQQGSPARQSATTSGEGAKTSLTVGYGDTQDPDKQPILATPAAGTTLYTADSQNIGYVSKKRGRSSIAVTDVKAIGSVSSGTPLEAKQLDLIDDVGSDTEGGSRINKRHSKNRTKRVSYIKHKQTRKNQHSRKTNKK